MQAVADVEPGPLQDACPGVARLLVPKCQLVRVSMEMIVEHGHNETVPGSHACCPRPSNSLPPSQVDALCGLSVLVCVTWRVDQWNAQPTVCTSVRLSVAAVRHGHGGHSFETISAREGEAIERSKTARQFGRERAAMKMSAR